MTSRNPTAILAMAAVLCGCVVGSSTKTSFYALSAEPAQVRDAAAPVAGADVTSVAVWQVAIPEIADRRHMVVRSSANRVEVSEQHQWAEPLKLGIARVLARDLEARLGPGYIVSAGQPVAGAPQLRVFVDFRRFEAVAGEGVTVEALWSVRPSRGEPRAGRSLAAEQAAAGDYAGIAAAYSRALARVAQDMAASVTAARAN